MTKNKTITRMLIAIAIAVVLALAALTVIGYDFFFKPRYSSSPTTPADTTYLDHVDTLAPQDEDSETKGDYTFNPGDTYCCYVNHDTAFAVISDIDGIRLQGHLFRLNDEDEWVDATPFVLTTRLFSYRLKIGDQEYKIHKKGISLHSIVDGNWHDLNDDNDNTYNFRAVSYQQPDFTTLVDSRYKGRLFDVHEVKDVTYAKNYGYWTEKKWDSSATYTKILLEGIKGTLKYQPLNLAMDIYLPASEKHRDAYDLQQVRPLILFIHGGAYYVGSKADPAIVMWCRDFASKGYVCASIDYRMGFFPIHDDIERTGYMATQDANAAMRFLVKNADKYGIDTKNLFVAGCSAGAITALNLAFMTEEDRPLTSYGYGNTAEKAKILAAALAEQANMQEQDDHDTANIEEEPSQQNDKKITKQIEKQKKKEERQRIKEETRNHKILQNDLGSLTTSGNSIQAPFHIRAVANMWGAVQQLNILKNGRTDIISFHGNADQIIPYNKGVPFQDSERKLGQRLTGTLYGSYAITNYAESIGLKAELHTLEGKGHAPHLNADCSINSDVFDRITNGITLFFYSELVQQPVLISADSDNPRHFFISSQEVGRCRWHIEGGFIVAVTPHDIWVVWRKDVPTHILYASGIYKNGIAFNTDRTL